LHFAPWIYRRPVRLAEHRFILQAGSCLPEPLDQVIAVAKNEYNTWARNGTNLWPQELGAFLT
jgi:hypothetical protein